jgi:AraC-like DNA-binding protein
MPVANTPYVHKTIDQIAQALNLPIKELRKKLKSENTGIRTIEENLRRDIACTRLRGFLSSIECIAEELGYKETRSFYRAFRSWTGCSPREYRKLVTSKKSETIRNSV